jgi:hypothetical protein
LQTSYAQLQNISTKVILNWYLPADPIGPDGVVWRQNAPLKYHNHRDYVVEAEFFRDDRARERDRRAIYRDLRNSDVYGYEAIHHYLKTKHEPHPNRYTVQPYEHHGFPMEPPTVQPMVTEDPNEQRPAALEPWFLNFLTATSQLGIPAQSYETQSPD